MLSMLDMLEYFVKRGAMRVSDLHIKVSTPPAYRIDGDLVKIKGPKITEQMAKQLLYPLMSNENRRKLRSERDQSEQELVTLDREVPAIFARLDNITQPPATTRTQLIELADESEGIDFDSARGSLALNPDTFFGSGCDRYVESGDNGPKASPATP